MWACFEKLQVRVAHTLLWEKVGSILSRDKGDQSGSIYWRDWLLLFNPVSTILDKAHCLQGRLWLIPCLAFSHCDVERNLIKQKIAICWGPFIYSLIHSCLLQILGVCVTYHVLSKHWREVNKSKSLPLTVLWTHAKKKKTGSQMNTM